jgi:hypothetical protein
MLDKLNYYVARVSIFLITAALIAGMVGCGLTSYALAIASTEGGLVTTPGEGMFTYDEGTVVNLVATPNAGCRFVNWTGNVSTVANVHAASTNITMNGDYLITANFVVVYDLIISSTEGGAVTTPGEGTFTYDEGTVGNLVAEAEEGYRFADWTGDVSTIGKVNAATTKITMNGDYAITANFAAEIPENLEVRTWYDLDAIRDNLGGTYYLMNDLDSTTPGYEELASPAANQGKGWEPIGTTWNNTFTGTFDGQGYKIRDLFINRPDGYGVGLFGWLGEAGVTKNIGIVNATVIGGIVVGSLVGGCYGTVSNSYSTGSVNGTTAVGGLVAVNSFGPVSNSYSTCSVTGNTYVGGLMAENGGPVSKCYATGSVSGDEHVGGLMGQSGGAVSNSYATGNVTGNNRYVGGLIGENGGTVRSSYSTGSVSGDTRVGGLIGLNAGWPYGDSVSNSYSTGSVTGNSYVGGLVGGSYGAVSNSYSTGSVTGNSYVGGLVGGSWCSDYSCGTVSNSFWDTETSGQSTSAGGTGKTTAEIKSIATFSGAGWNIITVALNQTNPAYIWNIVDNVTYPFLSWQP